MKAVFILKTFKFRSLIRKLPLISKFMGSSAGKQIVKTHILPNISRSKANQTKKFTQLIEYNTETFFLKNHTPKMEKIKHISASTV